MADSKVHHGFRASRVLGCWFLGVLGVFGSCVLGLRVEAAGLPNLQTCIGSFVGRLSRNQGTSLISKSQCKSCGKEVLFPVPTYVTAGLLVPKQPY